jgi:hypothetical protein
VLKLLTNQVAKKMALLLNNSSSADDKKERNMYYSGHTGMQQVLITETSVYNISLILI